jgi:C-terminal processing protease CtpA/Prc
MRKVVTMCVVMALAMAAPLLAGDGKKCSHSTQECLDSMTAKLQDRGWVGIEYDEDTMAVSRVVPDSPAMAAGFKDGDVMTAVNGIPLNDDNNAKLKKIDWSPGSELTYTVMRNGASKNLHVTLGKLPKDVMAQWVGNHMIEQHASVKVASLD